MLFVRLVNKDHRPYDFHQNQRKRILEPGEEAMVPWDVATSLFGDPDAVDTVQDQARQRAWTQSSAIHGFQVGGEDTGYGKEQNMTWEQWRPKIEVFDVETGRRVFMVMEDPNGEQHAASGSTRDAESNDRLNSSFLLGEIAKLQTQMAALVAAQMAAANAEGEGGGGAVPQGTSPFASQDAPDPADPSLGFGSPVPPVVVSYDDPAPVDAPDVSTTQDPQLKPSIGGAYVTDDETVDAIKMLAKLDLTDTHDAEVTEDKPQTIPSGPPPPKPKRKIAAKK